MRPLRNQSQSCNHSATRSKRGQKAVAGRHIIAPLALCLVVGRARLPASQGPPLPGRPPGNSACRGHPGPDSRRSGPPRPVVAFRGYISPVRPGPGATPGDRRHQGRRRSSSSCRAASAWAVGRGADPSPLHAATRGRSQRGGQSALAARPSVRPQARSSEGSAVIGGHHCWRMAT